MLEEVSFATTSPAPRKAAIILLPEAILSRYPPLPVEVTRFLGSLAICHNASQSICFLTPEDYAQAPSNEGFGAIVHGYAPKWEEHAVITERVVLENLLDRILEVESWDELLSASSS